MAEEVADAQSGLRIGLSLTGVAQQPRDGDMGPLLETLLGTVWRARELGFDHIYAGQLFMSRYQTLQPLPLLSRLAHEAGAMRLVGTLLLPLYHPVALAESLASLDWISEGRLTLSVRGYRSTEFSAFGATDRHASARLTECLRCLMALWSGDPVTFHGAHYRLDGVRVGLRPRQRPHPPVWFAASTDRGVRRAARLGLPWHVGPFADRATVVRQVELYRSEARHPHLALPLAREVCCADTHAEAVRIAARYLAGMYAGRAGWGRRTDPRGLADSFSELSRGRFVIGSPEECAEQLREYLGLGIGTLHVRLSWPGMPAELVRRSETLFAERVASRLR